MEEVEKLLYEYSNYIFELYEDKDKFADMIVKKMIRLNDSEKYIAYVCVVTQMKGNNAEILLRKIIQCDLLDPEILNEERTLYYDTLPGWAQDIIKN